MLSALANLAELIGFVAVIYGCWLIYEPAAVIVGGLGLILAGLAADR